LLRLEPEHMLKALLWTVVIVVVIVILAIIGFFDLLL
jgi:hypothetical protein